MKCEVIRDLIPLYDEKLCSDESAALVEEHVKTCDACRELLETLPKAEPPKADENAIKLFKKVKRKLRTNKIVLIVLGVLLLAVLAPVGYLTVNQIFHVNGGTDFQDLIYRSEMRQFAEMITEGRMEEYTQRYENLHIADYIDGSSVTYRNFYLEKLNAAYEKVKKYDPRVGVIHSSYHKFKDGDFIREVRFSLYFTLADGSGYEVIVLPGNYEGTGYGISDREDPRFMMALSELNGGKTYHSVYSAISEDEITTDRREIAEFINLLYLGDGGNYDVDVISKFLNKKTTDAMSEDMIEVIGYFLAVRFKTSDYNKVYNGVADYLRSGYTLETAVGERGFDTERQMFYYPIVLIGSDGENSAGISVKLYYDGQGFYSPRPGDIKGVSGGSDLEKKLVGIFG